MHKNKESIFIFLFRHKIIYFTTLGLILYSFFFRIYNLEADLPGFGIGFYQPIDEGLYSRAAINFHRYGSFLHTGNYSLDINPVFRSNILNTVLQIITLNLLGNNYIGFRFPSIIIALLIFLLIFMVARLLLKESKLESGMQNIIVIGLLAYVLMDFSFLLFSRVIENSNVRALSGVLTLYLFLILKNRIYGKYFMLGFMSIIAVFLVYFSNVYILFAMGLLGIHSLITRDWVKVKNMLVGGVPGITVGYVASELYYRMIWGSGAINNFIEGVFSFSRVQIVSQNHNIIREFVRNGLVFFSSNMFFLSPIFLFISLVALVANGYIAFRSKEETKLFLLFLIIATIIQSILFQDWMERKAILIYPVLILNIVLFIVNVYERKIILNIKSKAVVVVLFIGLCGFCYSMIRLRISQQYFNDFERIDIYITLIPMMLQLAIIGVGIGIITLRERFYRYIKGCILLCVAMSLAVNGYFSIKYVYTYNEFTERQAMKDIGEIIGNNYVLGPFAYGFTLYNDIRPVSVDIPTSQRYIRKRDVNYIIDYPDSGAWFAQHIYSGKRRSQVAVFERGFSTFGIRRAIGLYSSYNLPLSLE